VQGDTTRNELLSNSARK